MPRKKKFTVEDLYHQTHLLLMKVGYDQFTFSLLADELSVSRAAIYKYYSNKDVLISDYLTFEMKKLLEEFDQMEWSSDREEHFNQLFELIFNYSDVHQLSNVFTQKMKMKNEKIQFKENISKELHERFFGHIQSFILSCQETGFIKKELPANLLINMIFHSVIINTSSDLTQKERAGYIREILAHGMFQK